MKSISKSIIRSNQSNVITFPTRSQTIISASSIIGKRFMSTETKQQQQQSTQSTQINENKESVENKSVQEKIIDEDAASGLQNTTIPKPAVCFYLIFIILLC